MEECEEDLEWRTVSLVGSGASSGPPRPREAMSSTKEGRVVIEDGGQRKRQRQEEAGWGQPWTIAACRRGDYNARRLGNEPRESGCHERAEETGDVIEPRTRRGRYRADTDCPQQAVTEMHIVPHRPDHHRRQGNPPARPPLSPPTQPSIARPARGHTGSTAGARRHISDRPTTDILSLSSTSPQLCPTPCPRAHRRQRLPQHVRPESFLSATVSSLRLPLSVVRPLVLMDAKLFPAIRQHRKSGPQHS